MQLQFCQTSGPLLAAKAQIAPKTNGPLAGEDAVNGPIRDLGFGGM